MSPAQAPAGSHHVTSWQVTGPVPVSQKAAATRLDTKGLGGQRVGMGWQVDAWESAMAHSEGLFPWAGRFPRRASSLGLARPSRCGPTVRRVRFGSKLPKQPGDKLLPNENQRSNH